MYNTELDLIQDPIQGWMVSSRAWKNVTISQKGTNDVTIKGRRIFTWLDTMDFVGMLL